MSKLIAAILTLLLLPVGIYAHDNTGALLGINPSTPPPTPPDSKKPAITTFPAATGYLFSVVVTNRGDSDQWQVSAAVVGTANRPTSHTPAAPASPSSSKSAYSFAKTTPTTAKCRISHS